MTLSVYLNVCLAILLHDTCSCLKLILLRYEGPQKDFIHAQRWSRARCSSHEENFDGISISFEMNLLINSSISVWSQWRFVHTETAKFLTVCPTFCCNLIIDFGTITMKILIKFFVSRTGSLAIKQLGYFLLNCILFYNMAFNMVL